MSARIIHENPPPPPTPPLWGLKAFPHCRNWFTVTLQSHVLNLGEKNPKWHCPWCFLFINFHWGERTGRAFWSHSSNQGRIGYSCFVWCRLMNLLVISRSAYSILSSTLVCVCGFVESSLHPELGSPLSSAALTYGDAGIETTIVLHIVKKVISVECSALHRKRTHSNVTKDPWIPLGLVSCLSAFLSVAVLHSLVGWESIESVGGSNWFRLSVLSPSSQWIILMRQKFLNCDV